MLLMVVERFKDGSPNAVGERFRARGRMIPDERTVKYVTSWMSVDGSRCFQIMEAPDAAALEPWMANWRDLVEFEVTPVQTSAEFWSARPAVI